MKKGDPLPDSDHVVRHVPHKQIDPSTGLPTGAAFLDPELSVSWLERFRDADDALNEVRRCMSTVRKLGGLSRLAVLRVAEIKENVESAQIVYDAIPHYCHTTITVGHAGIYCSDLLAGLVTDADMHSAVPN